MSSTTPEGDKSKSCDWAEFDALTDDEVLAAALDDPDNPPMTEEELRRLRPVAKSKRIRWKLKLSREDFAARYRIPLDVVTSWERYTSEPDAVAAAYLDAIMGDPNGVLRALQSGAATPKAAE
jgi:putative transcriptional regulator